MPSKKELKNISLVRIKSAETLLKNNDWDGSAQMMGLALECALKAAICKTLRIQNYPESHKDKKVPEFFMTHGFDRLVLLAGMTDIFTATGDPAAFANWSAFTVQYPGEWTSMRYDPNKKFNQVITKNLFKSLMADPNSIIKIISRRKRW